MCDLPCLEAGGAGSIWALKNTPIIWDEETIARLFDIGPNKMFPGTKMPEQRLTNPRDRQDLVEFLKHATQKTDAD